METSVEIHLTMHTLVLSGMINKLNVYSKIFKTMHQIQQRDHTAVTKSTGIWVIHNIAVSNSAQIPL